MSYKIKPLVWALKQVSPSNPRFFIPAMQRPYVWKQNNLIALFESIYQGFPIGTSLVWHTQYDNPKNLGASRVFWVPKDYTENMQPSEARLDHGESITLILDGQQRLVTLTILFSVIRTLVKTTHAEDITKRIYGFQLLYGWR